MQVNIVIYKVVGARVAVQHEQNEDQNSCDVGQFIEAMQPYPYLYNLAHPEYKNIKKKERAWKEISGIVNMSMDNCQKMWKSLRDRFVKEKNKDKSGSEAPIRVWEHYDKMKFYEPFTKRRKTFTATRKTSQEPDLFRPSSSSSMISPQESDEDLIRSLISDTETPTSKRQRREKKSDNLDELILTAKNICSSVAQPKEKNVNESFGAYLVSRLKEMTPRRAVDIRKKILIILEDL
ncbi:hypothetical protein ABEB36_013745 [Hypothenemus hampei]|uniref:MADF domain-containing protein n=1 Tax=Hypothenemus hampei TaxID=57062 RepID=A0ABD1E559_HYPHA